MTPAEAGPTNFVEIGQARDKILSLKLDQVGRTNYDPSLHDSCSVYLPFRYLALRPHLAFPLPSIPKDTSPPSIVLC